ncbi:MAG TPA: hypothetical protein VFZ65_12450 [Planctomycetota bacterium]|nr:hypothetical protein [Planctomycetota bacterium]
MRAAGAKPATHLWRRATARAKIGPMPPESMSHPDRVAATLANLPDVRAARPGAVFAAPGAGAGDCRIDLKLLQWRALAAMQRAERARAHLERFGAAEHRDLWAGTVQDGVARGFAAALEEAIALAGAPALAPAAPGAAPGMQTFAGKELRKKKDLLVASGGARMRYSRKHGLLFVARADGVHSANCLRFEARRDLGTLDGFVADESERPRLYSAQFLQPQRYVQGQGHTELVLAGRLGRGPIGWPCELVLTGIEREPTLRLVLRLHNRLAGWRLRARFLGIAVEAIEHECTPVREVVHNDAGGFLAFTLVRACATLLVDGTPVAVPGALCLGTIEHTFRLGTIAP